MVPASGDASQADGEEPIDYLTAETPERPSKAVPFMASISAVMLLMLIVVVVVVKLAESPTDPEIAKRPDAPSKPVPWEEEQPPVRHHTTNANPVEQNPKDNGQPGNGDKPVDLARGGQSDTTPPVRDTPTQPVPMDKGADKTARPTEVADKGGTDKTSGELSDSLRSETARSSAVPKHSRAKKLSFQKVDERLFLMYALEALTKPR